MRLLNKHMCYYCEYMQQRFIRANGKKKELLIFTCPVSCVVCRVADILMLCSMFSSLLASGATFHWCSVCCLPRVLDLGDAKEEMPDGRLPRTQDLRDARKEIASPPCIAART